MIYRSSTPTGANDEVIELYTSHGEWDRMDLFGPINGLYLWLVASVIKLKKLIAFNAPN